MADTHPHDPRPVADDAVPVAEPTGPDRRRFLRLGGAGVLAAAVLAACSDDSETTPAETGETVPPTPTTASPAQTTTPEAGATQDAVVTRTARTIELALVDLYESLLGRSAAVELPTPVALSDETTAVFEVLLARHTTHAAELEAVVSEARGEPAREPNNGILEGIVAPQAADLTTENLVLRLVHSLEGMCASTYAWGAGTLSTPSLRQGLMEIGSVTARHPVLVALLINPTGRDAVTRPRVDASGPARVPDHMLVVVGKDGGDALTEEAPPSDAEAPEGEEAEGEGTETTEAGG